MKTKLDYYKVFYETARHSSFSMAAKELYISQSAISQCIVRLEQDLNTQLFIRNRRGVRLTREGNLLFQKIEGAMSSIEQGEKLLERLKRLDDGVLIIAAGDTITSEFLLPYLERFHALYPEIRIEMANSYSSQMLRCVKEGKAELAFVNLPAEDEELEIKPCLEIHDIFVCGSEYKLKESYTHKDIAKEPLIMLEKNSVSRKYVDNEFKKEGIELNPHIEMAAHNLLIKFASIHLGVSCVIEEFSRQALDEGAIKKLPLNPPIKPRSIGCAYLKQNPLSKAAEKFLELIL